MPPAPPSDDLYALQTLWRLLVGGVALAVVVLGTCAVLGWGRLDVESPAMWFYTNALLNVGAVAGSFALQYRLVVQRQAEGAFEAAVAAVRRDGVRSLALLEVSALFAGCAALATGQTVNLLFAVPFFAFAVLFYPSARRVRALADDEQTA